MPIVATNPPAAQGSTACSHPRSNHRLNLPALAGLLKTAGVLPRAKRALLAIAFQAGGDELRLSAPELAARTCSSRRTGFRAVRDLRDAGLLEYEARYLARSPRTGRPRRDNPIVRLSAFVRFVALQGAPSSAQIRRRARERLELAAALVASSRSTPGVSLSTFPSSSSDTVALTHVFSRPPRGPPSREELERRRAELLRQLERL